MLFRLVGAHPQWGITTGLAFQLVGLAICVASFLALGRSFGFVAADRGLVQRGPYAVVRHPIYASYILLQFGYVLQSISLDNALVMMVASGCNSVAPLPRTTSSRRTRTTTRTAIGSGGGSSRGLVDRVSHRRTECGRGDRGRDIRHRRTDLLTMETTGGGVRRIRKVLEPGKIDLCSSTWGLNRESLPESHPSPARTLTK